MINLNQYDGGKGQIYRHLINQMPPHNIFVSAFAGGCAVAMHKRPAKHNILIDKDERVITAWRDLLVKNGGAAASSNLAVLPGSIVNFDDASWQLIVGDSIDILPTLKLGPHALVYADPPYLFSTRTSQRPYYRFELSDGTKEADEKAHGRLLDVLDNLNCRVMLSGYWSTLYIDRLDWRMAEIQTYDRANKPRLEYIWMNYNEPLRLHDYSFLGDNFRERERIKRKASRWVNRFDSLPTLERRAIIRELESANVL